MRLPYYQLSRDGDGLRKVLSAHQLQKTSHRQQTHSFSWLAHSGKRWVCIRSYKKIIETNSRNIRRDAQALRMQRAQHSQRGHVVVAKNGGRRFFQSQQRLGDGDGLFRFPIAMYYQLREKWQGRTVQCLAIAGKSLGVRLVAETVAHIGDAAMPELN